MTLGVNNFLDFTHHLYRYKLLNCMMRGMHL